MQPAKIDKINKENIHAADPGNLPYEPVAKEKPLFSIYISPKIFTIRFKHFYFL